MRLEITDVDFGEWTRAERKKRKMSQQGLARLAYMHYNTVRRIERGEVSPTLDVAERIAEVFGSELVIRVKNDEERVLRDTE